MTNDNAIIDLELGASLVGGNKAMAEEMLGLLIGSLPEHKQKITKAFEEKDYPSLRNETHALHGATCYTGTPRLKACARALEQAAKHEDLDKLPALYSGLAKAIEEVLAHKA
jgi:two-component system sensor histidine kinase BarA